MKSFLIGMAVLIAAGIFLITSYSSIGKWVISGVADNEGTVDSMKEQVDKDPVAFSAKYQPFLDRRNLVGRTAEILDMDYFMELSKDTLDRYLDTPLQTDPTVEHFLVKRALELDAEVQAAQAWELYKRFMVLFPNDKDAATVKNAMVHLTLKYGYQ
jgi:hypothetical protein